MLSDIYRAQQAKRDGHRRALEISKKEAVAATQKVNRTLTLTVNKDVMKVHAKQQELENAALHLQKETHKFAKQTSKWVNTLNELNDAMKAVAGIDEWAQGVEDQLSTITTSLEYIAKVERTSTVDSPAK